MPALVLETDDRKTSLVSHLPLRSSWANGEPGYNVQWQHQERTVNESSGGKDREERINIPRLSLFLPVFSFLYTLVSSIPLLSLVCHTPILCPARADWTISEHNSQRNQILWWAKPSTFFLRTDWKLREGNQLGTVQPKTERPWRAGDRVVIFLYVFFPLECHCRESQSAFIRNFLRTETVHFAYISISYRHISGYHALFYCTSFCGYRVFQELQLCGNPMVKQVYQQHFSNSTCWLRVSVSHFVNSCNI